MGIRLVAGQGKIVIDEIEDRPDFGIERHGRQCLRTPRQLQPRLVQMVEIEMGVAQRMDELARFQA